jgi:uncharacterized protein (DUF2126 family)
VVFGKVALRRGALFAVPGDSALGYRLPLNSLPHVPPAAYPYIHPRDTAEPREPLADFRAQVIERGTQTREALARGEDIHFQPVQRTAQRAWPAGPRRTDHRHRRRGAHRDHGGAQGRSPVRVHPPVETLEDYLDLIASVEAVAEETGLPVRIEGYPRRPIRA